MNKGELLEIVKKNRKEHREVFLAAQKKYREKVISVLDEQLKLARNGDPFTLLRITALVAPQDYTKSYDTVVEMLEYEVEDTVKLDEQSFKRYVQDDWEWSHQWAASNSGYTSSPKFSKYLTETED